MMYLYGLLEPGHPVRSVDLEGLAGVTGPVTITEAGTVRLVHGPATTPDILPRRRDLLAHARVLETLAPGGPVLPMRFGMVTKEEVILAVLAGQKADIAQRFETVRGCAEYGIRVSFPREAALAAMVAQEPVVAAEKSRLATRGARGRMETAEFGRRLAELLDRRRAAAQRELLAALAPEFAAHILRAPDDDVQVLAIDALVSEARAEGLAHRIEAQARQNAFAPGAEPQVRLVGPGPAYSFVRLTLDTARWAA